MGLRKIIFQGRLIWFLLNCLRKKIDLQDQQETTRVEKTFWDSEYVVGDLEIKLEDKDNIKEPHKDEVRQIHILVSN